MSAASKSKRENLETETDTELPEGWATTTLGALSTYVTSGSRDWSEYYSDRGALFIRTQDINQNKLASVDRIARVALPERVEGKRTLIQQGDLLITITGANVGKCAYIDHGLPEAYVSQSVALVRLAQGFNGHFIQRQLISPSSGDERTLLQKCAYGVGRPVLNLDNVRDVPILFAPLDEQRRIVTRVDELLSYVDSASVRLSSVAARLRYFRQAVLAAACSGKLTEDWRRGHPSPEPVSAILRTIKARRDAQASSVTQRERLTEIYGYSEENDSGELPEGWSFLALNKLCSSFDYGTSSKSHTSGRVPVLRMGNIQNGRIDWDDLVYTSDRDEIRKYSLEPNTVLFNRTNSPELVGKTAIFRGERPAIFAGYLIRIVHSPELDPQYLNLCLNTPYAREFCLRVKTDGVSQSNINAQKLGTFEVPYCSVNEQREIVRRVDALFKLADAIEKRVAAATVRAAKLTQAILAKTFRGELVPTEAELAKREGREYEPASMLLERIKERAAAQAETKPPRKRRARPLHLSQASS